VPTGGSGLGDQPRRAHGDGVQRVAEPETAYVVRSEQNAADSDGTMVFSIKPMLSCGSKKTPILPANMENRSRIFVVALCSCAVFGKFPLPGTG